MLASAYCTFNTYLLFIVYWPKFIQLQKIVVLVVVVLTLRMMEVYSLEINSCNYSDFPRLLCLTLATDLRSL